MDYEYTTFRVMFYGRRSVYHTIQHISILATYIKTYGISAIHKIIFEFQRPLNHGSIYNNISICNAGNNSFKIQFYHYYNSFNQLYVLEPSIQERDYCKLYHFLYRIPLLNALLLPHISTPIYTYTNDLKELT